MPAPTPGTPTEFSPTLSLTQRVRSPDNLSGRTSQIEESLAKELTAHHLSLEAHLRDFGARQRRILERWGVPRPSLGQALAHQSGAGAWVSAARSLREAVDQGALWEPMTNGETFPGTLSDRNPVPPTPTPPPAHKHGSTTVPDSIPREDDEDGGITRESVQEVVGEKDAGRKGSMLQAPTYRPGGTRAVERDTVESLEVVIERGKGVLGLRSNKSFAHVGSNVVFTAKARLSYILGSLIGSAVTSSTFEAVCVTVIIANAVFMGWSADYAYRHIGEEQSTGMIVVELCLSLFYSMELVVRMSTVGCRSFYFGSDWRWNVFDSLLVLQSWYEQLMALLLTDVMNLAFLRILRLMKMLKLLRIIRVMRTFRELRLVVGSVLGGMKSMLWSFILIVGTTFVFGLIFLQVCTEYLEMEASASSEMRHLIDKYWSSVFTSMITLYAASTAGVDWSEPADPLKEVGIVAYATFLGYIAFFIFVIMNSLTSLYVEATIANSEKDQQTIIQEELEKKHLYIQRLRNFYETMDRDGDGEVTFEEFSKHLSAPEMHAFAQSLELDATDVKQFFIILSSQGRRPVDLETFVVGCIKLKGMAKSMDLMDLTYSFRRFQQTVMEHLEALESAVVSLRRNLGNESASEPAARGRETTLAPSRATLAR